MEILTFDTRHEYTLSLVESVTYISTGECGEMCQGECTTVIHLPDGVESGYRKTIVFSDNSRHYSILYNTSEVLSGPYVPRYTRETRYVIFLWIGEKYVVIGCNGVY